jgi:hypothetical protein
MVSEDLHNLAKALRGSLRRGTLTADRVEWATEILDVCADQVATLEASSRPVAVRADLPAGVADLEVFRAARRAGSIGPGAA